MVVVSLLCPNVVLASDLRTLSLDVPLFLIDVSYVTLSYLFIYFFLCVFT